RAGDDAVVGVAVERVEAVFGDYAAGIGVGDNVAVLVVVPLGDERLRGAVGLLDAEIRGANAAMEGVVVIFGDLSQSICDSAQFAGGEIGVVSELRRGSIEQVVVLFVDDAIEVVVVEVGVLAEGGKAVAEAAADVEGLGGEVARGVDETLRIAVRV